MSAWEYPDRNRDVGMRPDPYAHIPRRWVMGMAPTCPHPNPTRGSTIAERVRRWTCPDCGTELQDEARRKGSE